MSPFAVRQGTLGSCFFHASIASVAKASPSSIRDAIVTGPLGGYRVKFISGPEELVYWDDLDFARTRGYDHSEGEWVSVLMRGYAQRELRRSIIQAIERSTVLPTFTKPVIVAALRETSPLLVAYDRAIRSVVSQDGKLDKASLSTQLAKEFGLLGIPAAQTKILEGLLDEAGFFEAVSRTVQQNGEVFGAYRSIGQGGIPFNVLQALLGKAESVQIADSSALTAVLERMRFADQAMVAGTRDSLAPAVPLNSGTIADAGSSVDIIKTVNWFVADHAYSVLAYDEATRTIQLRNPWAGHPGPTGNFKLPLHVFEQTFANCTCSTR